MDGGDAGHIDALLEALLAARSTPANDRFDAEIAGAIARGQLDPTTARALRYRQRASVRAVETYLQETLAPLLRAREAAERHALDEVAADDNAWQQAREIATIAEPTKVSTPAAAGTLVDAETGVAKPEVIDLTEPVETAAVLHLAIVPDYVPASTAAEPTEQLPQTAIHPSQRPAIHPSQRTAAETRQAIRAALQSTQTSAPRGSDAGR
jgi:hypothetical protein